VPRTLKTGTQAGRPGRGGAGRGPSTRQASDEALHGLVARLTATCDTLAHALREAPKAADFQPLADHLYAFAQAAPRLVDSLHELSEGLVATRASFDEALLRMPRPEEYEPLAEPLRRFARTSPELIEVVRELQAIMAGMRGSSTSSGSVPPRARERLEQVAAEVDTAHRALVDALGSLPRDPDYAAVARQLRELATVSPSLMEWLEQVPRVAMPLAASAKGLQEAAAGLESAQQGLAEAIRGLARGLAFSRLRPARSRRRPLRPGRR
jgi:ABC-type transporter Mla subunit MlaD